MTKDTAPVVITLDEVMADYDGKLSALLAEHTETPNILITWQVTSAQWRCSRCCHLTSMQTTSGSKPLSRL